VATHEPRYLHRSVDPVRPRYVCLPCSGGDAVVPGFTNQRDIFVGLLRHLRDDCRPHITDDFSTQRGVGHRAGLGAFGDLWRRDRDHALWATQQNGGRVGGWRGVGLHLRLLVPMSHPISAGLRLEKTAIPR
jgi:hypothetical protein